MPGQDMVKTISAAWYGNLAQQAAFYQRIKISVHSAFAYIRIFHSNTVIHFFGSGVIC